MTIPRRDPIEGRNPPNLPDVPGACSKCGRSVLRVAMSRHPSIVISVEPEPEPDGTVVVYELDHGLEGKFLSGPDEYRIARESNLRRHHRHGIKCPNPMGLKGKEFDDWDKGSKSTAAVNKEETS